VADLLALHVGGVDPVDEGAALALVHRAGRADDEDRRAVDIRVIDAHGGVQHADHVMHDGDHRLARDLGVAMRDLHRDLLVLAQQHRRLVAAVIDQRVVQPAIARARIERDIGESELLDEIDDDVGLPALGGVGAFLGGRFFSRSAFGLGFFFAHPPEPLSPAVSTAAQAIQVFARE
jgi:hypothetical protein